MNNVAMQMAREKDQTQEAPQASSSESQAILEGLGVPSKVSTRHLNFYYGELQALFDNNLEIAENRVTAIIGPSGCGKSTHIRVYNRIYSMYRDQRAEGEVLLDGDNILDPNYDIMELRRKVGMIFQKPTPFPMSVFENVAYGLKLHYNLPKNEMKDRVEDALRRSALWDEVKDYLNRPGTALSGGQQQRLCIARTVAARVSDFTAFFFQGRIVEFGPTQQIFTMPKDRQTEDYITGRFG
jgi:phosphate transport system ATP-binding protein